MSTEIPPSPKKQVAVKERKVTLFFINDVYETEAIKGRGTKVTGQCAIIVAPPLAPVSLVSGPFSTVSFRPHDV